jgi:ribA/ribD-fused uncharacterized protein
MITFYGNKGPYGFLSNFYNAIFELEGKHWPTVEHYYQAAKATTVEDRDRIAAAGHPAEALKLGRAIHRRADWEAVVGEPALHTIFTDEQGIVVHTVKDHFMFTALTAKFTQRRELANALLRTGDELLVEDSPTDRYWGWGKKHDGQNKLGRMLQLIRRDLPERVNWTL